MQDVTDWAFWNLLSRYGGPDIYFTEYFRVTPHYRLDRSILRSIVENPTGRPVLAQLIGNDEEWMVKSAQLLESHPIFAVDLNLGCPAPVVYRKCAGGGLLRDPARMNSLLRALRQGIQGRFTVKTRLGFSSSTEFDRLIEIFASHRLDALTVHGRTVAEKYGPHVHLDRIAQAVRQLPFPILANGNIGTVDQAREVWQKTGAHGLMIGRGAIRNPWLFQQIRDSFEGREVFQPTGDHVLQYIEALYDSACSTDVSEFCQVQKMKKYMTFLAEGISPDFLHSIRRVTNKSDFFALCRKALDPSAPLSLDPRIALTPC